MAIGEITNPYEFFTNADGTPLEAGQIYIGVDGLDPQDNPQAAYFDLAGTIGATQPIRTLGGYPVNAGSATKIFTDGSFSVKVLDENNNLVYSDLSVSQIEDSVDSVTARVDDMAVPFDTVSGFFAATIADIKTAANATTGTAYVVVKDGGHRYKVDLAQGAAYQWTTSAGVEFTAIQGASGYNVLAFNAKMDGVTDDTAALQACADVCEMVASDSAGGTLNATNTPTLYIPGGYDGLKITAQVTIARNISVIMASPILVEAGASAVPASKGWVRVTGDGTESGRNCRYEIDVRRLTLSDWADEDDCGFYMDDSVSYDAWLKRFDKFTVGAYVSAAYTVQKLGEFRDNKLGIHIAHTPKQFTNQAVFMGGEFAVVNGSNNGKSRYGIRINDDGLGTGVNSMTFIGQSFELNETAAGAGECVSYLVDKMWNLECLSQRSEISGDVFARLTDDCRNCRFELIYGREESVPLRDRLDDQSTYKFHNIVQFCGDDPYHSTFETGLLRNRMTYANAGNLYALHGMVSIGSNGGLGTAASRVPTARISGNQPNDDGSITTSSIIGVTVNSQRAKDFILSGDIGTTAAVSIICYDENGDQITSAGCLFGDAVTATRAINTSVYGGVFIMSSVLTEDKQWKFTVTDDVKEFFVGISGTDVFGWSLKSFGHMTTAYTHDDPLDGIGRSQRTPLQGDYVTGQVVFYTNASSGAAPGYYVTQGGHKTRTFAGSPTAATTSGSSVITLSDADELKAGMYVDISGITGSFRVLARQGSWAKLDGNADATVASGAVTFTTPIVETMANIS